MRLLGTDFSQDLYLDGTPYTMKVVCTVWVGGKVGDCIKFLPIDINVVNYSKGSIDFEDF